MPCRRATPPLLWQIDAALKDAESNGRYARSYREWCGAEPPSLPEGE